VAAGHVTKTGAPGTGLTPFVTTLANELYVNELAHLKLLRGVLKANGPQCAPIDNSDVTFAAILTQRRLLTTLAPSGWCTITPHALLLMHKKMLLTLITILRCTHLHFAVCLQTALKPMRTASSSPLSSLKVCAAFTH
jgi:hypothetical protein